MICNRVCRFISIHQWHSIYTKLSCTSLVLPRKLFYRVMIWSIIVYGKKLRFVKIVFKVFHDKFYKKHFPRELLLWFEHRKMQDTIFIIFDVQPISLTLQLCSRLWCINVLLKLLFYSSKKFLIKRFNVWLLVTILDVVL